MKKQRMSVLIALVAGLSSVAQAGGNPEAGKAKAQVCVACHGTDGNGVSPDFPKIAGQYPDYLVQALSAYKAGTRSNPIMASQVQALSKQNIKDLAAYFSGMEGQLYVKR
jgi:cytochrome c553